MTPSKPVQLLGLHPHFFALLTLALLLTPTATAAHSEIGTDCPAGFAGFLCRVNAALARTAYCAVHLFHCAGFGGDDAQIGDEWTDDSTPPDDPDPTPPTTSPPPPHNPNPQPPGGGGDAGEITDSSKLCTAVLPDGICDFLANWRTILFSAVAIGISAPFIFLRNGISTVYGYLDLAIATLWGWIRYAFTYLTDLLVDVVTPSPATVAAWTALNASFQTAALATGPLAPLTLALIYLVLGSLGGYALYFAARAVLTLATGGRTA